MAEALEQLQAQCKDWGVHLDATQIERFAAYADLLAEYELANVVGTRDRDQIVSEHFVDSLSCLLASGAKWEGRLVDVGAGGGLPGIPLSIARPDLRVVLLEATEKKVRFLEHARAELNLGALTVLHARAEVPAKKEKYREAFDLATARALAAIPVVLEYCAPLVRVGGNIIAMKGRLHEEELSRGITAARELGANLSQTLEVAFLSQLPQKERRLLVFNKIRTTPSGFPRRVGLAKKRPIGL